MGPLTSVTLSHMPWQTTWRPKVPLSREPATLLATMHSYATSLHGGRQLHAECLHTCHAAAPAVRRRVWQQVQHQHSTTQHAQVDHAAAIPSASRASPASASAPAVTQHGRSNDRKSDQQGQRRSRPSADRNARQASVRAVAVQQLLRIEEEGAYAGLVNGAPQQQQAQEQHSRSVEADQDDPLLDSSNLKQQQDDSVSLSPMQQRSLRAMVSGVTRWRRRLDCILMQLAGRNMDVLDPAVRQVLRLGLFDLMYMELAPHAVNEYVTLTHTFGPKAKAAAKLVNAVLREAVRQMESGTLPVPEAKAPEGASIRQLARWLANVHSHTPWLVTSWLKQFGREATEQLMKCNNRPPIYTIRVNTLSGASLPSLVKQLQADGVDVSPCELLPGEFLTVHAGLQTLISKGYVSAGQCSVQDVAAGLVVGLALNPQPGEQVLDCCAAPGGKTLHAAARMQGQGSIAALDISPARVEAINRMAAACQLPAGLLTTEAADVLEWAPRQAPRTQWDRVLLDAPCSGTGVLGKRADLRWRRTAADVEELVKLQAQLLDAVAPLVRAQGVLVYSTCSLEDEENMQQVQAFLQRHPEFELQPVTAGEAAVHGVSPTVISEQGCLQVLPHVHGGCDGSFAARFVRKG